MSTAAIVETLKAVLKRPVAYHRVFAQIGGGATAGLMLSQAFYWTPKGNEAGWFYKSMQEWEEETGLTRTEQETARERLTKRGVLETKRAGMPARLYFRVNVERLAALIAENPQTRLQETRKQDAPEAADLIAENPQSTIKDSETTAETTTKTQHQPPRARAAFAHAVHPAVAVYRDTFGVDPPPFDQDLIARDVSDLAAWLTVCEQWKGNKNFEHKVWNMVDAYKKKVASSGQGSNQPKRAYGGKPVVTRDFSKYPTGS